MGSLTWWSNFEAVQVMPPRSPTHRKDLFLTSIGEAYNFFKNITDCHLPQPNFEISFETSKKIRTVTSNSASLRNKKLQNRMANSTNTAKEEGGHKERGDKCKVCNEHVAEGDRGVNCDMCEFWHHTKCVNMNNASYKMYEKENLQWVCSQCIEESKDENRLHKLILQIMKNNEEEKEKDREERAMMMLMMMKLGDQMSGLEKSLEDRIDMKFKVTEKSMMSKINEDVEEKLETFKRRKIIILHTVYLKKKTGMKQEELKVMLYT